MCSSDLSIRIGVATSGAELAKMAGQLDGLQGVQLGWKQVWCAGFDVDETGKKHFHHLENIPCQCDPGPHALALSSYADEVLCGGGKGSGKSECTFAFILRGNLSRWRRREKPYDGMRVDQELKALPPSGVDVSYVNSKHYTFLVIRKTAKDLDDWFRRFKMLVEPMGAECTVSPMRVVFPSGATGYFGHLDDMDSIRALQGKRFIRIVVEELTQIKDEKFYLEAIVAGCASAWHDLHPQIMTTCNPGGPGEPWVVARWMNPQGGAERWPEGRLYRYQVDVNGERKERTRAYFLSTVMDNPYYLHGEAGYVTALASLKDTDETMFRRYYGGEFGVVEGLYFSRFRRKWRGPQSGEPENAVHVVKPANLAPWWPRAISLDWGYKHDSAAYWGCWTPQQQLHVYRELVVSGVGTVELGARIAEIAARDMADMTNPRMNLYLSHDCFHRTDYVNTEAEQIQRGIQSVLGDGAAFVMGTTIDEDSLPSEEAWAAVRRRHEREGDKASITLIPAGGAGKRKPGWQLIREYLRWWILSDQKLDDAAMQRVLQTQGTLALQKLMKAQQVEAARALPVLQIWEDCKRLIQWMEQAAEATRDSEDVEKVDGDDPGDSLNYLVSNFLFGSGQKPRDVWIAEQVAARIPAGADINTRVRANEWAESEWRRRAGGGAVSQIPRVGTRRRQSVYANVQ